MFAADGSSSEFRRSEKKLSERAPGAWGELSVLDPTREGAERLDLAPRLPPATQLLMSHELRRASQRLHRVPKGRELSYGDGRRVLEEVFEPLPEGMNALPSFSVGSQCVMGALFLLDQEHTGCGTVELAVIDTISPRHGWNAPFLHRSDERGELFCRLLDVEERTGRANPRKASAPEVVLSPSHFVCRVQLEKEGRSYRLDAEGLERMKAMKWCMTERNDRMKKAQAAPAAPAAAAAAPVTPALDAKAVEEAASNPSADNLSKLPSPARSGRTP